MAKINLSQVKRDPERNGRKVDGVFFNITFEDSANAMIMYHDDLGADYLKLKGEHVTKIRELISEIVTECVEL